MKQLRVARHHDRTEDGYVVLIAIFLLVLLMIALSVATPVIIKRIQLDRERETMERGKQYRRAVQLYYRKFHAYPPSVSALIQTNNIRFLREQYLDPMTGKDDWQFILFGQNKTPTAMGFFGQPLGGLGGTGMSTMAGIGPSGGNGIGGDTGGGSSSVFNSGPGYSSGSGSANSPGGTGPNGNAGSTDSTTGTNSSTGNQTFGGAGIIGFSPGCARQSIMIYKKKDHYNEWEFTYDPIGDKSLLAGNTVIDSPPGASLVGVGSLPNGTGPTTSTSPSPLETPIL